MLHNEEWIGNFRFIEYKEWNLEKPSTLVIGFPDTGLVGVIGTSYLANKLGLEEVGGIDSPYLPPIAVIHKGVLRTPIRIFSSNRIGVIYTELTLGADIITALIPAIIDYARIKRFEQIIGLTGIAKPNRLDASELITYYVSTIGKTEIVEKAGARMLENGVLIGPYALLLKEAARRRVPAFVLLTESFLEFPDPEATAAGLTTLSRIVGIELDVGELLQQAEIIRFKARDLMRRATQSFSQMGKDLEYSVPLHM
uniref:Proteasome assembly chaperone family protein n=1 Tax=Ignisphaera aggregans TaxID=334771 RepID=A0A7C2VH59_9CREN